MAIASATVPLHDSFLLCCLCSGTIRLVSSARNMPFTLRWDAVQHRVRELVHFRSSELLLLPPTHVPGGHLPTPRQPPR
ncbi:hypothetical protein F5883DRAFT_552490 [Diaporthe sp. PMI_573]|nr:hypothetical protein F5883DRAFT_552490 [Diaporthaceae sp. PMI_573]